MEFAEAFRSARRAMQIEQRELAKRLGLSSRSLIRWEGGEVLPRDMVRQEVVEWLSSIPPEHGEPALRALGVLLPAPPSKSVASQTEIVKVYLEHAVLSAAEAHQLPPGALRAAVARVLEAVEKTGASLATARALIASQAPEKR